MNKTTPDFTGVLRLEKLVFDKILFERKGFKNTNELKISSQVKIGINPKTNLYKVSLQLDGNKEREYQLMICISGFFTVNSEWEDRKDELLSKNAVAILMPYVRTQLSLLTAQPETDCVVLPTFNINAMLDSAVSEHQSASSAAHGIKQ